MKKPDIWIAENLARILSNGGGYVDSHHQYFKPLKEESPCITTRTDSSSQVYLVIAKPL